jgi:hypothetical protein
MSISRTGKAKFQNKTAPLRRYVSGMALVRIKKRFMDDLLSKR